MAKTGFVYHETYLEHKTGSGHPERPERLKHLVEYLRTTQIYERVNQLSPQPAELSWIEKIHPKSYIKNIRDSCGTGLQYLDSDTVVSEKSYEVALLAAGGVMQACEKVVRGEYENVFCAVRPPGHHAEPARAMGFCLFNNIAVAARYLQAQHSMEKVCIIDWDVHHGNGTQNVFYEDGTVFYISIHQHPLYPGTGMADEIGIAAGEGATLNFPSPPGFGDREYLDIFNERITPAVQKFDPDFILISAGFDAHRDDPLANMEVTEDGFSGMTAVVKELAADCCDGRLVSVLEGGYNLQALAKNVEKHLQILLN